MQLNLGGTQTGTKTNGNQNANFSNFRELAVLKINRFDIPLGAARETPKLVPKNGYQNAQFEKKNKRLFYFERICLIKTICLISPWVLLRIIPGFGGRTTPIITLK